MKREEALKEIEKNWGILITTAPWMSDALRVAIEALKEQEYDSDLISKQATIDEVVTWTVEDRPDIEMPTDLVGRVNALPSAQPEIIRCEDCLHNGSFDTDCPIRWNGKEYCSFGERIDQ